MPASRVTPALNPLVRVENEDDTVPLGPITSVAPTNIPFLDYDAPIGFWQVWVSLQVQASTPGTRVRVGLVQGIANTNIKAAEREFTAPATTFPVQTFGTVTQITAGERIAAAISSNAGSVTIYQRTMFFLNLGNSAAGS